MKQTDKMRALIVEHGMNEDKVCAAYAHAEQMGEVTRKSNKRGLTAEQYAVRLWKDGIRKGWTSK